MSTLWRKYARMRPKKRSLLWVMIPIVAALLVVRWIAAPRFDPEILGQLTGTLYYKKRDDGILNLYTSKADLSNERLVYTHRGYGEDNENVTWFHYDQAADLIHFIAQRGGEWTLFSVRPEGGEAIPLRKAEVSDDASFRRGYVQPESAGLKAFSRKGSLYLLRGGQEILLKRYYGFYVQDLFPGYWAYGFSPDGKYLVYGLGQRRFIMELSTRHVSRFLDGAHDVQWVD